ncbi:hypothetical protein V8B97DRAFT_1862920 [Scleroderma yunnanense]
MPASRAQDVASSSSAFIYRKPSGVQGPRPCTTWFSRSTFTESQDLWTWTYWHADLSRGLSIYSRSFDGSVRASSPSSSSSYTSSSSVVDCTQSISYARGPSQSRRKPAGPRAPRRSRHSRRPILRIDTSVRPDEPRLPQSAESVTDNFSRSHTPEIPSSATSSPYHNFLLDWDAIFRLLGCSFDVLQEG